MAFSNFISSNLNSSLGKFPSNSNTLGKLYMVFSLGCFLIQYYSPVHIHLLYSYKVLSFFLPLYSHPLIMAEIRLINFYF